MRYGRLDFSEELSTELCLKMERSATDREVIAVDPQWENPNIPAVPRLESVHEQTHGERGGLEFPRTFKTFQA